MKKISKRKALILLSLGLLVITSSQILNQYIELTDFTKGSLIGIGLGLLFISILFRNIKTA